MSLVTQEYLDINPDRILFQKLLHELKFLKHKIVEMFDF